MVTILDGKKIASEMGAELLEEIKWLKESQGITPTLALILIEGDDASSLYVKKKAEVCQSRGMHAILKVLSEDAKEEDLIELVSKFNADRAIHGIMVQLPLPQHIREDAVRSAIALEKDVDGLNPASLGSLMLGKDCFAAAGADAAKEILRRNGITLKNKHIVVVGASEILGKPFAALMMLEGAVVTVCPSTSESGVYTRLADLLLVDVGVPHTIKKDMVKMGCVIIDAGNNRVEGKLLGDVDFDEVKDVASAITPVPGGLGPMIIMMLMKNLILAAKRRAQTKLE